MPLGSISEDITKDNWPSRLWEKEWVHLWVDLNMMALLTGGKMCMLGSSEWKYIIGGMSLGYISLWLFLYPPFSAFPDATMPTSSATYSCSHDVLPQCGLVCVEPGKHSLTPPPQGASFGHFVTVKVSKHSHMWLRCSWLRKPASSFYFIATHFI